MDLSVRRSQRAALVPEQLERLQLALEPLHAAFDPDQGLVLGGSGRQLDTLRSLEYATALLDVGTEDYRWRALTLLSSVLALQEKDSNHSDYGLWPLRPGIEEEQLRPVEAAWRELVGVRMLEIGFLHRHSLPEGLAEDVQAAVQHAASAVQRRDPGILSCGPAITGTYLTLIGGELRRSLPLFAYGMLRLKRVHDLCLSGGGFREYNSPTHLLLALRELERLRSHTRHEEARWLADELYRWVWEVVAGHYHAPSGQWAGPHRDASGPLLPPATRAFLLQAAGLSSPRSLHPFSLEAHRLPLLCPEDLRSAFAGCQEKRTQRESSFADLSIGITTHLAPAYTLGSASQEEMAPGRQPVVAYWGSPEAPSYLRALVLSDGRELAWARLSTAQQEGRLLGVVTLDWEQAPADGALSTSDLRFRIELGGAAGQECPDLPRSLWSSARLDLGGLRLTLQVAHAELGETQGRWETGLDRGIAYLDVALYHGPRREVSAEDADPALLGFALGLAAEDEGTDPITVRTQGSLLELEWRGLRLRAPRPAPAPDATGEVMWEERAAG